MASEDRKKKAQVRTKIKTKVKSKTSKRIENWMSLMQELDARMPRNVEDIYDALITNGMPLESFPTFVQAAYKAKKEARKRKPI